MSDGGLVGYSNPGKISASYSTGIVQQVSGSDIGGVVGQDNSSGGFADTYWDTTTSGITNFSQGAGNIANDPGLAGLTTTQLLSGLPSGFTVWAQNPNVNGGLPYLIANPPP